MRNIIILFFLLILAINTQGQNFKGRHIFGKKYAHELIKKATNDSAKFNKCDKKKLLLANEKSSLEFAENHLFINSDTESITAQRPYEIYLIDNYWYIRGTLPEHMLGGTFTLIINAVNKNIIFEKHTK